VGDRYKKFKQSQSVSDKLASPQTKKPRQLRLGFFVDELRLGYGRIGEERGVGVCPPIAKGWNVETTCGTDVPLAKGRKGLRP